MNQRHETDISSNLWQQATAAMDKGHWREARALLELLIADEPDNAQALNKLGVCFAELNDLDAAEKAFGSALDKHPNLAQAVSNLGNVALTRGDASKAVEHYLKAIRLDPEYVIAHKNLSIAYKRLGQIDKSVAELKRAHALESRSRQSQGYLAPESEGVRPGPGMWSCLIWVSVIAALVLILVLLR